MEAQKKRISPYIYLIIIVLSYLTAGFCQYRLQPILTYMMQGMQIDEGKAGVLVSALSILSIFLAVPFGVMMGKIGPRRTGIFAMILIIAGSLVGVFGTKSYTVMFLSQLVVGAGTCATGILGPYVIACLFAPELRGRANGIYITGGTIAQLVMYNLVPRITTAENIAPAWWFTIGYSVVMLVVWVIFITDEVAPPMGKNGSGAPKIRFLEAIRDKNVLQLAIGGLFFMMSTMAIMSFAPTFLVVDGLALERVAEVVVSNEDLERLRSLSRELYLSEQELDYLRRTNDFRNRLAAETNSQAIADARSDMQLYEGLQQVNKDRLLADDELDKFYTVLSREKRMDFTGQCLIHL